MLCLGDSLTEGLGVASDQAWPALLEKELRAGAYPSVKIVNAGISGATAASGPGRLKWHLKGPDKADVIVLELANRPGALGEVARRLARADINIEYAYCSATPQQEGGCLILKSEEPERAIELLREM